MCVTSSLISMYRNTFGVCLESRVSWVAKSHQRWLVFLLRKTTALALADVCFVELCVLDNACEISNTSAVKRDLKSTSYI